jgi:hypothetical protein
VQWQSRSHFFAIAADDARVLWSIMRAARRQKRGPGATVLGRCRQRAPPPNVDVLCSTRRSISRR